MMPKLMAISEKDTKWPRWEGGDTSDMYRGSMESPARQPSVQGVWMNLVRIRRATVSFDRLLFSDTPTVLVHTPSPTPIPTKVRPTMAMAKLCRPLQAATRGRSKEIE